MINWDKGPDELEKTVALVCDGDKKESRNLRVGDMLLLHYMIEYYQEGQDN